MGKLESVDWTKLDQYPEDICYCKCGKEYKSHSMLRFDDGQSVLETRVKCPSCSKSINNCCKVSSPTEMFNI